MQAKVAADVSAIGLTVNDLARMTHPVIGRESLREHVSKMVAVVRDFLQVDGAIARVIEGDNLVLLAADGIPKEQLAKTISTNSGIAKSMIRSRQPVIVTDVESHPETAHLADTAPQDPRAYVFESYAGTPMLIDEEVIGVLGVYSMSSQRAFHPDEIDQLQVLANHIAASIVNDRLYRELSDRTESLRIEITERKHAESRRKELEERLRVSQKMESLGRMAGGIAHDFNNLLTVMTAGLELIETANDSKKNIANLRDAIHAATGMTNQLLAFSRHQPSKPRSVDMQNFLDDSESMLRSLLPREIELTIDVEGTGLIIEIDPTQLTQILLNLVTNAKDAIGESGVVRICCRCTSAPLTASQAVQDTIELTVEDDGCGMTTEVARQVFEPFYTTRGASRGTGLGLSTVHGIVGQLGGDISVESVLGVGSTFRVLFPPLGDVSLKMNDCPIASTSSATRVRRVLLCEDNDLVRGVLVATLESEGIEVAAAGTAKQTLQLISDGGEPFDLLITDLDLPDGRGDQLASRIREIVSGIPALLITGYVPDQSLEQIRQFDHVLTKPIRRADLFEAISRCVG